MKCVHSFKPHVFLSLAPLLLLTLSSFNLGHAQDLVFRRNPSLNIPTILNITADTEANADDPPEDVADDDDEVIAHETVSSSAADSGAFAEADGMGTATVSVPFDAVTVAPTVDATQFLRAVAEGGAARAESFVNEGNIDAPASFTLEGPDPEVQIYLNGFVYLAENGGFVESGESANAELDTDRNMFASINGAQANGYVEVNSEGVKTAILNADLPGVTINATVGSINHLFHFVVPITLGSGITMEAGIPGFGGIATTNIEGDSASIQWSFKSIAWAYVTPDIPQLEVNTTELVFGDFNGDLLVDAADFTVWRDSLGQTGTGLPADADRDGVVDNDDYFIWKLTFGLPVTSLESAASHVSGVEVPEPGSRVLFAFAAIACCICFRILRCR
jgi:hypothetical protein